ALDGNRGSGAQYLPQRPGSDARISRIQIHYDIRANLRLDGGRVSRSFQGDSAAGARGPLGSDRWNVGRTRSQHAGRRVSGAPDPRGEALFPRKIRSGREDWLESGFVRLQLAVAANLQEVRHRLFRDAKTHVGAEIYHLPPQIILVG